MWGFGFNFNRYRTVAPAHLRRGGVIAPQDGVVPTEYISIPRGDIWEWAKQYTRWVETAETDDTCRCLWRMHPDDIGTKPGHCRSCGNKKKHAIHDTEDSGGHVAAHLFQGIRKAMVDTHPQCPVHTKEGFLAGFFDWIEKYQ